MKPNSRYSPWNLYWVESDGVEDCFVAARNSRSACSVEINMNGFDTGEVTAIKVLRIPSTVENRFNKPGKNGRPKWPWYVCGKGFFKAVGAQFRTIDNTSEMLLQDVVYTVTDYRPCEIIRARSVGKKAISELWKLSEEVDLTYEEEDIWAESTIHLITMLEMCLARCQQIEHYIANAFLLGISKKQKNKYETINDLRRGWQKKTFRNMLKGIEEAWKIEPLVKISFQMFLETRNKLVHDLITSDQYHIQTYWGQQELVAFLQFFDIHSRLVRKAFKAAYHASLSFAISYWGLDGKFDVESFLKDDEIESSSLFVHFFTPKEGCI